MTTTRNDDTRHVCMGCGKNFRIAKLATHQATCARYQLECRLIAAQDKIKT